MHNVHQFLLFQKKKKKMIGKKSNDDVEIWTELVFYLLFIFSRYFLESVAFILIFFIMFLK